ncbi:hypothetical protein PT974_11578 [Cladobotryum mycophilum]|uniref:DNA replication factor Cdt1 C-terminal domain-containing protein n=1 Tax=Cladobotryum mycophilum TaxID=491253 RepID=A0ABR0S6J5_9HYPO
MARPTRRRQVETAPAPQAITSFARVSKGQAFPDTTSKKAAAVTTAPASTRKRKATETLAEDDNHPQVTKRTVSFAPSSDDEQLLTPVKRTRREEPAKPILAKVLRTPQKTPQKASRKTPVKTPQKAIPSPIFVKTTPSGRQAKLEDYNYTSRRADNGADLIRLHKAFLKTTLLHIAHNGRNTPIDIAAISPNISRNWGKRQVTVDDIRRCVAIETSVQDPSIISPFIVSDYGRGKVCVELRPDMIRDNTTIYEDNICKQFEDNIRHICTERARDEMCDIDLPLEDLSLDDLPQAAVLKREVGIQANPLLAKGHRALSELKNDIVEKQQEKEAKQQAATNNAAVNTNGTKMSLLDRIRLKQLTKANEPPPSGPELERRAALNRVADVAATISMLSLSNPSSLSRQAFTMTLISDKLKDSLRVPISREEGMSCIRLIAKEVAPEWLKVVSVGGRENVVVQRNGQPVDRILHERVQKLLG